jgi:predicted Zn-dependent protease
MIIFKPTLSPAEFDATARALNRFMGGSVEYDVRHASDPRAAENVRMGGQLLRALRSEGPLRIDTTGFLMPELGTPLDQLRREGRGAIGIGLTNEPLFAARNGVEQEELGVGLYRRGAIVSVAGLRRRFGFDRRTGRCERDADVAMRALELAVCHELGHVLIESYGRSGKNPVEEAHCPYSSCLMQENSGLGDFVERIVRRGFGFCRECTQRIGMELGLLRPA